MLPPGLYEQVINNALTRELAELPEACKAVAPIDRAEASRVLAQYLADVVQKGLVNVLDNGGAGGQSSFLRFYGRGTRGSQPAGLRRTSSARRPPSPGAVSSPAPSASRRCTPSSKRR